jgi:hypothetical protein
MLEDHVQVTLTLSEDDAYTLSFALKVAIDSGALISSYARVVEMRRSLREQLEAAKAARDEEEGLE